SRGSDVGSLRGLFAVAGVMAAVSAVTILIGKNLLFSSPTEHQANWNGPDNSRYQSQPASAPFASSAASIDPDPVPVIPPPPPCMCERADSPLWSDGVPRMSVIAHNRPGTTSYDRPSVYPEIAVVNNSSDDLKDVVMVVDFLLGPRDGRKARVIDKQDLFWEGRLGPGKAVKWRISGRGDDYVVKSFVDGTIGQGTKPAAADAFYTLTMTANTPSVRLHGAMMLAYLGDARVVEGLEKLRREGRPEQEDMVLQIEAASQALRVCSVYSAPDPGDASKLVVKACVYNSASVDATRPWVTARAQFGSVSSDARWPLPEDLRSKTGLITTGSIRVPSSGDDIDPRTAVVRVEATR
ncbi:MAG: hypothetical protein FWD57_06620, partial [Polyangiaceae bacterium]|nr:hypothetical protein [Polyangiaceae bacterium]